MTLVFKTLDARVLTMLRIRELTRYQIHEQLDGPERVKESAVNNLLESLWYRDLIQREGLLYGLSKRGAAALHLIDSARPAHRVDVEKEALTFARSPDPLPVYEADRELMMRGRVRATSRADLAPAPPRAGSRQFLDCPSRYGNTLRHRDGRVTDMAGTPISRRV